MQQVLLIVLPGKLFSVAAAFRTKALAEKIRLPLSFSILLHYLLTIL